MTDNTKQKVRLDKWLWAARFFKTRSLAKKAIEGGKVQADKKKVKVSKTISTGETLTVRQGWDEKTVLVIALSEQRRGAAEAALLYEETADSIENRKLQTEQRKSHGGGVLAPDSRPTKKQRRMLDKFLDQQDQQD